MEAKTLPAPAVNPLNGIANEGGAAVIADKCTELASGKNGFCQNGYLNGICNGYTSRGAANADETTGSRAGRAAGEQLENGGQANGNSAASVHPKEATNGQLVPRIPRPFRPNRRLRIAQIAPLYESVPPKMYGGTERVVHYLTEELVRRGHQVSLFCSADSQSSAEMIFHPFWPSLRLNTEKARIALIPFMCMLEMVRKRMDDFDILHFHTIEHFGMLHFGSMMKRSVTTLHGKLSLPEYVPFFESFDAASLVSISDDQRQHMDYKANFAGTVHHGIPSELLTFTATPAGETPYLAFLGRIAEEKRPDWAIEIAVKAGIPLKIAAKVDKADVEYWEELVKPLVEKHSDLVEYIGEITDREKSAFLGNARGLLFPIDWIEPFGLVMIESMACGTPIIARSCGSVPEVIDDGVTGIIFNTVDEGVEAAKRVHKMDRALVRSTFDKRFSAEIMGEKYLKIYENLLSNIE